MRFVAERRDGPEPGVASIAEDSSRPVDGEKGVTPWDVPFDSLRHLEPGRPRGTQQVKGPVVNSSWGPD